MELLGKIALVFVIWTVVSFPFAVLIGKFLAVSTTELPPNKYSAPRVDDK